MEEGNRSSMEMAHEADEAIARLLATDEHDAATEALSQVIEARHTTGDDPLAVLETLLSSEAVDHAARQRPTPLTDGGVSRLQLGIDAQPRLGPLLDGIPINGGSSCSLNCRCAGASGATQRNPTHLYTSPPRNRPGPASSALSQRRGNPIGLHLIGGPHQLAAACHPVPIRPAIPLEYA